MTKPHITIQIRFSPSRFCTWGHCITVAERKVFEGDISLGSVTWQEFFLLEELSSVSRVLVLLTSARVLLKMAGLEKASVGFHARVRASGRASWHGKRSGTDLQICSSVRLALHAKYYTSISI